MCHAVCLTNLSIYLFVCLLGEFIPIPKPNTQNSDTSVASDDVYLAVFVHDNLHNQSELRLYDGELYSD